MRLWCTLAMVVRVARLWRRGDDAGSSARAERAGGRRGAHGAEPRGRGVAPAGRQRATGRTAGDGGMPPRGRLAPKKVSIALTTHRWSRLPRIMPRQADILGATLRSAHRPKPPQRKWPLSTIFSLQKQWSMLKYCSFLLMGRLEDTSCQDGRNRRRSTNCGRRSRAGRRGCWDLTFGSR